MKTIILATIAAIAVGGLLLNQGAPRMLSTPVDAAWTQWKMTHGRVYGSSTEESYRKAVFVENYNLIQESNANPKHTFTLALNKFGDLTGAEFKKNYTGLRMNPNRKSNAPPAVSTGGSITADVDWRNVANSVNAVKDQGQCGSCWAFSAVCAMEFADARANGGLGLRDLSEQQLVDCDTVDSGCNGGLMDYAFEYAHNSGLHSTADYGAYHAADETCHNSSTSGTVYTPVSFQDVTSQNQDALVGAVKGRVVSIAVEADRYAWQFYSSGILNSTSCGTSLDHGVAMVGVNTTAGYYVVRNSWGSSWGEQGYIRLAITGDGPGICGCQMQPSYPTN